MATRTDWRHRLATGRTLEEELESLYYEARTDEEIASLLSAVSGQKISKYAARQKRQALKLGKGRQGAPLMRPSTAPVYDKPPRVEGDALIMCDVHVPFHDAPWCNRVIDLALAWGVPTLVLAGDIVDLASLKPFSPFHIEEEPSFEDELDAASGVFDALAAFEKILYISGGHELRLLRTLKQPVTLARFAAMFTDLPQLECSAYHKCDIGDGWHISHPKNTSVIPGRIPFWLVAKHRKNCAVGHDHAWGQVQDVSGRNIALSVGVCCDPARLDYVALQDNTRPAVCQGALIIKRGLPWLLSPKWTDFRALKTISW